MSILNCYLHTGNDADLSTAVDCEGKSLTKVQIPQAFSGTVITIKASVDGENFADLLDSTDTVVSKTVTAGGVYTFEPAITQGLKAIKIATTTTQTADRLFKLGFLND